MAIQPDEIKSALEKIDRHLRKLEAAASEGDLTEARHLSDRYEAARSERATRLRGWTLAANSGGLLLLLNGVVTDELCQTPSVDRIVWYFILGLACVFFSEAAERRVFHSLRARADRMIGLLTDTRRLLTMANQLRSDPSDPNAENEIENMLRLADSLDERVSNKPSDSRVTFWGRTAFGLEGLAVSFFALGASHAILNPTLLTSCGTS